MITSNALLAALVGFAAAHAGHNHGEKYQQKKFVGETKEDCQYGLHCAHAMANLDEWTQNGVKNGASLASTHSPISLTQGVCKTLTKNMISPYWGRLCE